MNLTINTGAALEDATQIDSIVSQIQEDMQTLDKAIKQNIPGVIDTDWANTLKDNWNKYYSADVPAAMEDMKLSASNLRRAVEAAINYSQEQ